MDGIEKRKKEKNTKKEFPMSNELSLSRPGLCHVYDMMMMMPAMSVQVPNSGVEA